MIAPPWLVFWFFLMPQQPSVTFTLNVAIANDPEGAPVARPEWLEQQVTQAEKLFEPLGVRFTRRDAPPLDASADHLETRADRDALAARAVPHVINVFVVESLRDVDEAGRARRGVHWHAPSGAHYVIVIASAPPSVLAHELGHFFGNPHSPVPDNLMSYERTGAPVFFDEAQGRRVEARAWQYVRSGELTQAR